MVTSGLNYKNLVFENAVTQKNAKFYILKLLTRSGLINKPIGTSTPNLKTFRIPL